jgi:hypothetical protein
MLPSRILRRVVLVRTDDCEEHITSIIMVKRIGELGITLALTVVIAIVHSSPILIPVLRSTF